MEKAGLYWSNYSLVTGLVCGIRIKTPTILLTSLVCNVLCLLSIIDLSSV